MRKEVSTPTIIGIIVLVVVVVGLAGYFKLRAPAASGPVSAADIKATDDPLSASKMGPNSKKGTPIPPDSPSLQGVQGSGNIK